jgi:AraC family transcriptional regulator
MYIPEKGVLENSSIFFNTPSNISKSMLFYLKCAGHFFCNKDYLLKRDDYSSFLLMYIISGEGTIYYEDKVFYAKPNDVVILNCYKPHIYTTSKWETKWIHFDGNVSKEYYELICNTLGPVIPLNNSIIIPALLTTILNSFKNGILPNEHKASCYIQEMLTELLMVSPENNLEVKNQNITDTIFYIESNFRKELTLNDLASVAAISPYHYSRIFKKKTGYSPYEYIVMIRINHAKKLLKTSNMRIKEIAYETGFNSESNFVTSFKKHTHYTPKEFRGIPF